MALPILKLNLVPSPTPWRRHHELIGWLSLVAGLAIAASVTTLIWQDYRKASQAGAQAVALTQKARDAARKEAAIISELAAVDVAKELPRWRLAERILTERSQPWSRIVSELERSLVQDVRLKSLHRVRAESGPRAISLRLKGEAKNREAEAAFIESLKKNAFFVTPELEREAERQGGGVDFELTLPLAADPPAYVPLPKFGPDRKTVDAAKLAATPLKPAAARASTPPPPPHPPAPTAQPARPARPEGERTVPRDRIRMAPAREEVRR